MNTTLSIPNNPFPQSRSRRSWIYVLGFLASAVLSLPAIGQQEMVWFTGKNLGNVDINIGGAPPTYDANGLDIDLSNVNDQNPPKQNDVYSLSFVTGGSAFVDIEDKTYAADNPGANANAEDLMSTHLSNVSVEPDLLHPDLMDLTFDAVYGPADLPADIKTFMKGTEAEAYVSVDYDPDNNNQVASVYVTLTSLPDQQSNASLLGLAIGCLITTRHWLGKARPHRKA